MDESSAVSVDRSAPGTYSAELCRLFAENLELDLVMADTDYFLAGGHSLSALTLAVAIEGALGVEVKVRDIFDCATPASLAERLAGQSLSAPVTEPVSASFEEGLIGGEPPGLPVDNATRWLWLERQRGAGANTAYTVPCLFHGRGELDVERIREGLRALQIRNPVLRGVFVEFRGVPRMVVNPEASPVRVVDLREPETDGTRFQELVDAYVDEPFDVATGPLFRAVVFLREHRRWSLLFVADHLVCDGTGLEILARQLVEMYRSPWTDGVAALSPPSDVSPEAGLSYWRQRLSPPPEPLPLPISSPRREPVGDTDIVVRDVPRESVERLRGIAARARAGLFVPLAAATAKGLAELTGSFDVCLGTAVDRRARLGQVDAVGFHVATVPLRLSVQPGTEWEDLVAQVAGRTMDAVDHSMVSFDELVASLRPPRAEWRAPYFDIWVALFPHIDTGEASQGGISLSGGPLPLRQGVFELSFQFVEHEDGLRLRLQYDALRYDEGTVRRMAERVLENIEKLTGGTDAAEAPRSDSAKLFGGFRFD